jgi:soluble lytic murein transglycosylase
MAVALAGLAAPGAMAQSGPSSAEEAIYRSALEAAELGAWSTAVTLAAQTSDDAMAEVLRWQRMAAPDGNAGFAEITAFLDSHPDWPDLTDLRLQAERVMPAGISDAERITWHERYAPLTFDATFAYLQALRDTGRMDDAAAYARARWTDIPITEDQQLQLLAEFGSALSAADHQARLDNLLWDGRFDEARALFPLLDAGQVALAEARIMLRLRQPGVDAAIRAVPASLQSDEGLIYERVRWRRRAGLDGGAIELLAEQPSAMDRAWRWWTERHYQAREALYDRNYQLAYDLASSHRQSDGFPQIQAEWLSGWLALRFLNDPQRALPHFQVLASPESTPITFARGAYWCGRSYAALGNAAEATRWFEAAAEHPTTYYGQLAAGEVGEPTIASLPGMPGVSAAERAAFEDQVMVRAVRALTALDEVDLAETFFFHLIDQAETPADFQLLGELALSIGNRYFAVRAGKGAVQEGIDVIDAAYPMVPLDTIDPRLDAALALGIMRTESEFRVDAISGAGARGIMQLMPATAQRAAGEVGVGYDRDRLTSDARYNIQLGSHWLADRIALRGGSYIMAVAAYNAGDSRVDFWINRSGNPRQQELYEVIDWIETISFYETRNYVMRVMETAQVYRYLLGGPTAVGALEADLTR